VYRLDPKSQTVSKYIRHGPTIFIPTANEWWVTLHAYVWNHIISFRLHEFEWHGTDPENKTKKIPGAMKFTKLQVIPDQFYYNVCTVSEFCFIFFLYGSLIGGWSQNSWWCSDQSETHDFLWATGHWENGMIIVFPFSDSDIVRNWLIYSNPSNQINLFSSLVIFYKWSDCRFHQVGLFCLNPYV
jgi:hypothetical protein